MVAQQLSNFSSPAGNAEFGEFYVSGDRLFFQLNDDELWVTEGELGSTNKVADVAVAGELIHAQELDYFVVKSESGDAVWRTDGTAEGTFEVIPARNLTPGKTYAPTVFEELGLTFFKVLHNDQCELWVDSAEMEGAKELTRNASPILFNEGACDGGLVSSGNTLFLSTDDEGLRRRLYSIDPQTFDFQLISNGYRSIRQFDDATFFSVEDGDITHIYKTDGSLENTEAFVSTPGMWGAFTFYKNRLYYFATNDDGYLRLWVSDGTEEGTEIFIDETFGIRSYFSGALGDVLLLNLMSTGGESYVWRSDGTVEGTYALLGNGEYDLSLRSVGVIAGKTYYLVHGRHITTVYRTDGITAEPVMNYASGPAVQTKEGGLLLISGTTFSPSAPTTFYIDPSGELRTLPDYRAGR